MSHLSTNTSQHKRHVVPQQAAILIQDSPKPHHPLDGQHIPYHEPTQASLPHHSETVQLSPGLMRQRQQGIVS